MKISENGVALIKQFEGLELEAYQDIAGIWTIGYGHIETAREGMRISEREAEALLRRDLKPRESAVDRLASVPLNQNEFDALVSFVYNVGIEGFRRSTARKRLNRGDRLGAADALTWWNKATVGGVLREVTGLTRRRAAERARFLTPTAPPVVNDAKQLDANTRATPMEDTPRRDTLAGSRTVQGATVAGGAGAASTSLGRQSAEELDRIEANQDLAADPAEEPAPADEPASDPAPDPANDNAPDADEGDAPVADVDENGDVVIGDGEGATEEGVEVPEGRTSKIEVSTVESQIQFALMILIALAVIYIIYARIDDWWQFRR